MWLKAVAVAAIDDLLRIGAIGIAVMLLDAPDKLQEQAASRAACVDVGRAETICRQTADVTGALQDDRAPDLRFGDGDAGHDAGWRAANDDGVEFVCWGRRPIFCLQDGRITESPLHLPARRASHRLAPAKLQCGGLLSHLLFQREGDEDL